MYTFWSTKFKAKSGIKLIDIGIPQASVLGPLLFLICVNQMGRASGWHGGILSEGWEQSH